MHEIYKYVVSLDRDLAGTVEMKNPIQFLQADLTPDLSKLTVWAIVGGLSVMHRFKVCPTGVSAPMEANNGRGYDHIKTIIQRAPGETPLVWHVFSLGMDFK